MAAWKKIAVLNVGLIIGIGLSLFILPSSTPVWLWGAASASVVMALNVFSIARRSPTEPRGSISIAGQVGGGIAVALLLVELLVRVLSHS